MVLYRSILRVRVLAYNSAGLGDPVTANATTLAIGEAVGVPGPG